MLWRSEETGVTASTVNGVMAWMAIKSGKQTDAYNINQDQLHVNHRSIEAQAPDAETEIGTWVQREGASSEEIPLQREQDAAAAAQEPAYRPRKACQEGEDEAVHGGLP